MDVGIAFFLLGIVAALARTDIQFPKALYQTLILYLLLAIGLMAVMGPGVKNIIIALALVGIPTYGRVVRGAVLSIRQKEYIEAARNAMDRAGDIDPALIRAVWELISRDLLAPASTTFRGRIRLPM